MSPEPSAFFFKSMRDDSSASLCLLSLVRGLLTFASSIFHLPSLYGVLVNFPVLHDDDKVLRRVLDALDVRERVAVDEQEVGESSLFDHAELARVRIALPG